jgi:hypothetical protein
LSFIKYFFFEIVAGTIDLMEKLKTRTFGGYVFGAT